LHLIAHWLGLDNAAGSVYLFWSGFAGDLAEFAVVGVLWRRLNCHAKGCYRLGLHTVPGTHFVTCRKHHPVLGGEPATAEEIAEAHSQAKEV